MHPYLREIKRKKVNILVGFLYSEFPIVCIYDLSSGAPINIFSFLLISQALYEPPFMTSASMWEHLSAHNYFKRIKKYTLISPY